MREAHFVNATVGHYYPSSVIFFDSETEWEKFSNTRQIHRIKLAVLSHWRYFKNKGWREQKELVSSDKNAIADFMNKSVRKRSTTYLFAHNIQFDLLVCGLFESLSALGWTLESFYFKGMVSIFEWRNDTRKIVALDSANYFQGKLADIGETMGLPKMLIDFTTCSQEYLIEYCRNDVTILVKMFMSWLAFLKEHDLGSFKRTLASTSFNIWRFKFLGHKVYIHDNKEVLELEAKSYHGGRVEMFRRGVYRDGPYYRLDVNAMYPSIMYDEKFPVSLYGFKYNFHAEKLADKLEKYAVIADVTFETSEPAFPVETPNALIYPTGVHRATLSTPELRLLMDCGQIHKIHFASWYQHLPIFTTFMDFLYGLRMTYRVEGNKPYEKMAKVLANSSYGKWGQRTLSTVYLDKQAGLQAHVEHRYDLDAHYHYKVVHIAGRAYEIRPGGFSYHAFPAIASHVTAYGRIRIYRLIRLAGRENVYHIDTDGLIVNSLGYERLKQLIDPEKLGFLKIEEVCEWIEVKAPKHYLTPTVLKTKGIRSNALELCFDMYQQDHFASLNTMLMRGDISAVHVDKIIKVLQFPIRSGQLQSDGSILPFDYLE